MVEAVENRSYPAPADQPRASFGIASLEDVDRNLLRVIIAPQKTP